MRGKIYHFTDRESEKQYICDTQKVTNRAKILIQVFLIFKKLFIGCFLRLIKSID